MTPRRSPSPTTPTALGSSKSRVGPPRRHLGDGYEIEVGGSTIKYVSLAGAIVARKEGDAKTWVHTDHLGSIQAATDDAGDEVHRKSYHPYGEILATDGTLAFEPRGYTGQRHDASNLVYIHARYYDPALARFISPDSILDGSDTIGLNRYAYVGNDPVDGQCKDGKCTGGLGSRVGARLKSFIGPAAAKVAAAGGAALIIGAVPLNPTAAALPSGPVGGPIAQSSQLVFGNAAAPELDLSKRIGKARGDAGGRIADVADAAAGMQKQRRNWWAGTRHPSRASTSGAPGRTRGRTTIVRPSLTARPPRGVRGGGGLLAGGILEGMASAGEERLNGGSLTDQLREGAEGTVNGILGPLRDAQELSEMTAQTGLHSPLQRLHHAVMSRMPRFEVEW